MSKMYPVNLILEGQHAVVVGAGSVGTRKIEGLLECDARVTVIAPEPTEEVLTLAQSGRIELQVREFQPGDLDTADIVFVATNIESVNKRVYEDAVARHLMINVADKPEVCNFFLPSQLRRGHLSIAVSTEGASPLLARRIREKLEEQFSESWSAYIDLLASRRNRVNTEVPEHERKNYWEAAIDGRVLSLIEAGKSKEAEELLDSILTEYINK